MFLILLCILLPTLVSLCDDEDCLVCYHVGDIEDSGVMNGVRILF